MEGKRRLSGAAGLLCSCRTVNRHFMCKSTSPVIVNFSEKIRGIRPPCPPAVTGKQVTITLYDPKGLMAGRDDLKTALTQVAQFYGALKTAQGLAASLAADLSLYTFTAVYKAAAPGANEIAALGRMDFPLYVFNSPGLSPNSSSLEEIKAIMNLHGLAGFSNLRILQQNPDTLPILTTPVDFIKSVDESWADQFVLGFGFPGNYYAKGTCNKLGIIKLDALEKNKPVNASAADRFRGVLIHELGHMFAVRHDEGSIPLTIMHKEYKGGLTHFSNEQIDVIRDTLKKLSP